MRIFLPLAVLSALNVWAQGQAPSPGQKPAASSTPQTLQVTIPAEAVAPISSLPPATVVATVDGKKVTAGELQAVLKALPPQVQQQAQADRRRFLEQYGILRRLADEARQQKLDQQSPYKESIEYGAMQVLYQAEMNRKFAEIPVAPEDIKKAYEANKDKYVQARVRAIYLPFSTAPVSQADSKGKPLLTEAEAKAKAEDIVKQIRGGTDFVKMVKEYSADPKSVQKDGDFGFIHQTDPIPADLKKVIFSAKIGEITEPVRQANGFYIFRVDEVGPQPYTEVEGAITNELKQAQFGTWISSLQKSIDIKMEHEVPSTVYTVPKASGSAAQPAK